jgi:UDP-N-acetylmuramoyl-L-alanyl-D-glutamate--2,6-diaminopimelate ligase
VIIEANRDEYKYITDNSQECNSDTAFLDTKLSHKYLDNAKENNTPKVIDVEELKKTLSTNIKIIAITGTNGKTTTAGCIYSILLDLDYKVALLGTRGFFINDEKKCSYTYTTPLTLELYSKIDEAVKNGCEYFVMEVSSHAIDQDRIAGLEFDVKVHTNITSDHLDYHKTEEEYIKVKNSFFSDSSKKVINKDDPKIKFNYENAITYGMETAGVSKVIAYSLTDGIHAVVKYFDEVSEFSSPLVGIFNIYNLLASITAVKHSTNKPLKDICEALEYFAGVSGRMEVVSTEPFVVIDFAHTEDGIKNVLESFQTQESIVIFGAGGDRDRFKRPLMGKAAELGANQIIITDDNPRSEDADGIIDDILMGISNKSKVQVIADRESAIKKGLEMMGKDSVLLVLGKGDEEYQEIDGKKIPYSDKETILKLLEK